MHVFPKYSVTIQKKKKNEFHDKLTSYVRNEFWFLKRLCMYGRMRRIYRHRYPWHNKRKKNEATCTIQAWYKHELNIMFYIWLASMPTYIDINFFPNRICQDLMYVYSGISWSRCRTYFRNITMQAVDINQFYKCRKCAKVEYWTPRRTIT